MDVRLRLVPRKGKNMKFLLDTADLEEIKRGLDIFPLAGVTTNPSILAKSGAPMYEHLRKIRELIGKDGYLHAQVMGDTCELMIKDAKKMCAEVGDDLYIKVPMTQEGLKAIRELKKLGFHVTATAVFSYGQALLAAEAGADFVAPYISRMMRGGIDAYEVVNKISTTYLMNDCSTHILAASFKDSSQVDACFDNGCEFVTATLAILEQMLAHPLTDEAVAGFVSDWQKAYHGVLPQDM